MWHAIQPSSVGGRLANAYALIFGLSVLVLVTFAFVTARQWVSHRIDQMIETEWREIESSRDIAAELFVRKTNERGLRYGFQSSTGAVLGGDLPAMNAAIGWFAFELQDDAPESEGDNYRALSKPAKTGVLIVAADIDDLENMTDALLSVYLATLLLSVLLAFFGGRWLSRVFSRRLDQLALVADDIAEGALSKRMPISAHRDEFDRLSMALNQMLDRNAGMLEQQRQITNDMAHDLRTPLAKLQQKLEAGNLSAALIDSTAMLEIVSSLLRITELEESPRKNNTDFIDLQQVANRMYEAYQPLFEEQKKRLEASEPISALIKGDAQLLSQLLSNLLDNTLKHAITSTVTRIAIEESAQSWTLTVSDDGTGVAEDELTKIFVRFHRQEHSRRTPGNGLGLSLVKAIALHHEGEVEAQNLHPGLAIKVRLPKLLP